MSAISIIVPIYNQEKYLAQCVESLFSQTLKDIEIILVDDGSTDKSAKLCDDLKRKDSRICVIHKENGGLSDARNAGIKVAKGGYIAFLDSDDYVRCDMYEKLYKEAQKSNADVVICDCQTVDDDGNELSMPSMILGRNCYSGAEVLQSKLDGTMAGQWLLVVAWNKLYRKNVFETVRFPKGKYHEDEFVFHDIIKEDYKVAFVTEKLYFYRQHMGTITSTDRWIIKLDKIEAWYQRALFFIEAGYKESVVELERIMHSLIVEMCQHKKPSVVEKGKIRNASKLCRKINIEMYKEQIISFFRLIYNYSFYTFPRIFLFYNRVKEKIKRMWREKIYGRTMDNDY